MPKSLYARLARQFGPAPDPVTRREMLALSLAAGAAMLAGCAGAGKTPPAARNGKNVLVVGAGLAGLACARELKAGGFEVKVLDARPRVGGRVLSNDKFVPGKTVEMGGEFIGANHPAWVAYAKHYGLELYEEPEDDDGDAPIWLDGKALTTEEAEQVFEEMETAFTLINEDARAIEPYAPWTSPRAAEFDAMSVRRWISEKSGASTMVQEAMATLFTIDNGLAADRQSYLGLLAVVKGHGLEAYWSDTEIYRCKGGTQGLAQKLADEVGSENLIKGAQVHSVAVNDDSVTVNTRSAGSHKAGALVMAIPSNAYRNIVFEPKLPADYFPTQGTVIKYLSRMKSPFWREAGLAPDVLSNGPVGMTWHATAGQLKSGEDSEVCLTAFSGGPGAEECSSKSREADAFYHPKLEGYFAGYGEQLVGGQLIDWPVDQLAGGGYCFAEPGQVTARGPRLEKPFAECVHFAGEHTCLPFIGFMEGALQSGVRAAGRVAAAAGVAITTVGAGR